MALPSHQQNSMYVFGYSLLDLLNHQQALQKDTTVVIAKLSYLQSQYMEITF